MPFSHLLLVGCLGLVAIARADTPSPPQLRVVASPDGSALVRITPGRWGDANPLPASATVLSFDHATGDYRKVATFALRNPVAPHTAVITNQGRFIVTFDDWAGVGRTPNVVVVYRGTGEVVRAWSLADILSEAERKRLISSTSSTWWRGEVSLLESRAQPATVIIQPYSPLLPIGGYKKGPTLLFDVEKLTFLPQ